MNEKGLRITWLSNSPWTPTGYGVQTKLFVPRIKALGHDPAMINYFGQEGGMMNWNGITCYPRHVHPYGQDIFAAHSQNWKADICMTWTDSWILDAEHYPLGMLWVPWYPIDHEPDPNTPNGTGMPPMIRSKLATAFKRIACSKYGVEHTRRAGMDCYYVPNGVDTKAFTPLDMKESRKKLGLPEDAFIVGTVAMNKGNPSRKNFPELLRAFADFHRKHADTVYYLHTQTSEHGENGGINLPALAMSLGLQPGKDVFFTDQYSMLLGMPDEFLATLYSSLNVHLLVSMGEGFGIPIVEAQACGCPVIVGDWTSMSELCFSGRMIDKKDAQPIWTGLMQYQYVPNVGAIEDALYAEYLKPSPRDRARRMAMDYDADAITEKYWKPTLDSIEKIIRELTHV
jgi:glycosyltransferase involved in cell wall biosynthesis